MLLTLSHSALCKKDWDKQNPKGSAGAYSAYWKDMGAVDKQVCYQASPELYHFKISCPYSHGLTLLRYLE